MRAVTTEARHTDAPSVEFYYAAIADPLVLQQAASQHIEAMDEKVEYPAPLSPSMEQRA